MKISELISALQQAQAEHGDVEVYRTDHEPVQITQPDVAFLYNDFVYDTSAGILHDVMDLMMSDEDPIIMAKNKWHENVHLHGMNSKTTWCNTFAINVIQWREMYKRLKNSPRVVLLK